MITKDPKKPYGPRHKVVIIGLLAFSQHLCNTLGAVLGAGADDGKLLATAAVTQIERNAVLTQLKTARNCMGRKRTLARTRTVSAASARNMRLPRTRNRLTQLLSYNRLSHATANYTEPIGSDFM